MRALRASLVGMAERIIGYPFGEHIVLAGRPAGPPPEGLGEGIRIWLDDERRAPVGYTHHARSVAEARALFAAHTVAFISFDHDLAPEHYATPPDYTRVPNGAALAEELARQAEAGELAPLQWRAHSLRPEGCTAIAGFMERAEAAWRRGTARS